MNFKDFQSAANYAQQIARSTGIPISVKPSAEGWEVKDKLNSGIKVTIDSVIRQEKKLNSINASHPSIPFRPHIDSRLIVKANNMPGTHGITGMCFVCRHAETTEVIPRGKLSIFCKLKNQPIRVIPDECNTFSDARGEKNFEPLNNLVGNKSYAINKAKRK